MEIFIAMSTISGFTILVPIIAGALKFKSLTLPLRLLLCFVLIGAISECLLAYVARHGRPNHLVSHYYTIIELVLLSYIYSLILERKFKKWIIWVTVVYLAIAAIQLLVPEAYSRFNNVNTVIEGFILVGYAIVYFDAQLQGRIEPNKSIYWFNKAVFIYFSLSTLFFIFNQYFETTSKTGHILVWLFHSVVNIVFNLLLALSLWRSRTNTAYFSRL